MRSLLELSDREADVKHRLKVLVGNAMIHTPNIAKLLAELDQIQSEKDECGDYEPYEPKCVYMKAKRAIRKATGKEA